MKILITGIAGAIGSHLAERLLELNHEVIGIDALTSYYSVDIKKINAKTVESKGARIHYINLVTNPLDEVVSNVDVIFHLAAQPGISNTTSFEEYVTNNIIATQRLLEVAHKSPHLKCFFHASTSSIYGAHAHSNETAEPKPTSNYGVTKLAAEQLALSYFRQKKMPVSVLRFFSVYGERERPEKFYHRLIKAILDGEEMPIYEGSLNHVRSYSYVSDIIDGCILVLNNSDKAIGEIFNLGTDKTNTTGEGLELIERIIGIKAKIKVMPPRPGDQLETATNITKMKTFFGYNPKVSLEEGLRAEVKWYKENIQGKVR